MNGDDEKTVLKMFGHGQHRQSESRPPGSRFNFVYIIQNRPRTHDGMYGLNHFFFSFSFSQIAEIVKKKNENLTF